MNHDLPLVCPNTQLVPSGTDVPILYERGELMALGFDADLPCLIEIILGKRYMDSEHFPLDSPQLDRRISKSPRQKETVAALRQKGYTTTTEPINIDNLDVIR